MGQISLPRFNRINSSMTWESSLKVNNYRWLSLKLVLFLKLYIPCIFKVTQYNFFNLWGLTLKDRIISNLSISNFIKKSFLTLTFGIALIEAEKKLLNILGVYLTRLFDSSYIYIVYNHYSALKTVLNLTPNFSKFIYDFYLSNFQLYLVY